MLCSPNPLSSLSLQKEKNTVKEETRQREQNTLQKRRRAAAAAGGVVLLIVDIGCLFLRQAFCIHTTVTGRLTAMGAQLSITNQI
jgi:hypothetical protein